MFARLLVKLFGDSENAPAYFGLVLFLSAALAIGVLIGLCIGGLCHA